MPTYIFNISNVQNNFVINGEVNPPLFLANDITYIFNVQVDPIYPFWIQTVAGPYNQSANFQSPYLSTNGISSGSIYLVINHSIPETLYYATNNELNMTNRLYIENCPSVDPVPCYCKGTLILTNNGYIKIEDIKKDDLVVIKGIIISNGIYKKHVSSIEVPVIWIKSIKVKNLNSDSRPICITKNAFREGYPFEDLYVSPGHRLLINDKMVLAKDLINGEIIYKDYDCESVEYYHLECEEHSALYANGVLAETYLDLNREIFDTE
jgi:hypothetical protein